MAEDTVVAEASAVLPSAEVEIDKTEVVAVEASPATEPAAESKEATEVVSTTTEVKIDVTALNGEAASGNDATTVADAEEPAVPAAEDTEMKDAEETENATADKAEAVATTPASTKKTPNGSSKKKGTAVPEHKNKKLNKKKSKPTLRLDAQPGELYLARMKGHQPWPSIICDEEMLPETLLKSRPVTTPLPDGTYKKADYAPGGKREHERTFPIMFLHTNEFAWLPNTELTPITAQECKDAPEKGKSKGIIAAYKLAGEDNDLDYYKNLLIEHQKAIQADIDAKEEKEAKKAEKANKAKRKSEATLADDDDDEMEVDDEDADSKPKSKKRKKSAADDDGEEKPAKTPKTGAKIKLTAPKTPSSESASKKKQTPKTKSASKKSAAAQAVGSDDDLDTPKVEEKPLSPAEARKKLEKEIRYYRHKLQKGFITRDYTPNDEEIKSMSTFLQKLEGYPDLESGIIRETKINKVLKAMIKLPSIPKDDEFNFKQRSQDLLAKWNLILNSDTIDAGKDGEKEDDKDAKDEAKDDSEDKSDSKPNGVKEDEPAPTTEKDDEASGADATTETATKDDTPAALKTKIGSGVEGEKEAPNKPTEDTKISEDVEMKSDEPATAEEPNVDKPAEGYTAPAETAEATA